MCWSGDEGELVYYNWTRYSIAIENWIVGVLMNLTAKFMSGSVNI